MAVSFAVIVHLAEPVIVAVPVPVPVNVHGNGSLDRDRAVVADAVRRRSSRGKA